MTLEQDLLKEREKAETSLETEERKARGEVRRESEAARRQLSRRRGNLLEQTQRAKSQVRQAERLEQRKADLPMTKPRDIGADKALKDIEKQAQSIEQEIEGLEEKIKTAEASALADIERQVSEKRAELNTLYEQGLAEIEEWKSRHIQVKDDWITKEDWDRLDAKSQNILQERGFDGYNDWVKGEVARYEREYNEALIRAEQERKEWEASHVKLAYKDPDTGEHEWVSREEWDKLSTQDKTALTGLGVKAFNAYQRSIAGMNFINQSYTEALFRGNYIQVGNDWIAKSDYDKLTPRQKVVINEVGIDQFNNWNMADYKFQQYGNIYTADPEAFRRALGQAINAGDIKDTTVSFGKGPSGQIEADINQFRTVGQIKEYWDNLNNQQRGLLWNRYEPTATVGESWVQAAEMFIPGVAVARNWDEMSNEERGLHIALDALIIGTLFAKPVIGAVRNLATEGLGSARVSTITRAISNLRTAINKGDATAIRLATRDLRKVGSQLRNEKIPEGQSLLEQADWFDKNADMLARKGLKPPANIKARLDNATQTIRGFIEPQARPGAVGFSKEAVQQIRELKPKIAPKEKLVHPLTREEFNRYTKSLTTEQRARIANTSATTREGVIKEVRRFAEENARRDKIWRDIEKQLEQARPTKRIEPSPAAPGLIKEKPFIPTPTRLTPSQLRQMNEFLAKRVFVSKKAKSALEIAIERARVQSKQRLDELLKQYAKGGKDSATAINQILAEGLISNLVANAPRTAFKILSEANSSDRARALSILNPELKQAIESAMASATGQSIAKAQTLANAQTRASAILDYALKIEPELEIKVETDTKLDAPTKTAIKTMIKTMEVGRIERIPREPEPSKPKRRRHFDSEGNLIIDDKKITKEQLKASVAWKQGFIYKLIYPPYGEKNIINTREPIEGVKYHTGPESAYRSLTQLYKGELPPVIRRDMGIMDIEITAGHTTLGGKKTKPKIKFRQDKRQATKTTPVVSRVR